MDTCQDAPKCRAFARDIASVCTHAQISTRHTVEEPSSLYLVDCYTLLELQGIPVIGWLNFFSDFFFYRDRVIRV